MFGFIKRANILNFLLKKIFFVFYFLFLKRRGAPRLYVERHIRTEDRSIPSF